MTAICVLGIRGGTSTVAGVLKQLGVDLGPEDQLLGPHEDNQKGFFEFMPFHFINVEILHRYGGEWHEPPAFPAGWVSQCEDLVDQARNETQRTFGKSDLWAFKDPRCCLTFPFWERVIGPEIKGIIVVRNPLDTARSLDAVHRIGVQKGSELWLEYMSKAFLHSRSYPRLVIFYEDLLERLEEWAVKCAEFSGVKTPFQVDAAKAFVSKELHRQRSSFEQVMEDLIISDYAKRAYEGLVKVKSAWSDPGEWPDRMEGCFYPPTKNLDGGL